MGQGQTFSPKDEGADIESEDMVKFALFSTVVTG
jgi:hypothetical protein